MNGQYGIALGQEPLGKTHIPCNRLEQVGYEARGFAYDARGTGNGLHHKEGARKLRHTRGDGDNYKQFDKYEKQCGIYKGNQKNAAFRKTKQVGEKFGF